MKKKQAKFDPNQPYEVVEDKFDPNQPYEVLDDVETSQEVPSEGTASTLQDAITATRSFPMGFGDEIRGAVSALYRKLKDEGKEKDFLDLYREEQRKEADIIAGARERSPIASMVAEAGADAAGMLIGGQMPVIGKGVQAITQSPTLQGLLTGAGESGAEVLGSDQPITEAAKLATSAGIGAATGKGLSAIGGLVASPFKKPMEKKANMLGVSKSGFEKTGTIQDPIDAVSELEKTGMFKFFKKKDLNWIFSPKKEKFVKASPSTDLQYTRRIKSEGMTPRQVFLNRMNEIEKKAGGEVDRIISNVDTIFTPEQIISETGIGKELGLLARQRSAGLADKAKISDDITKIVKIFQENISEGKGLTELNEMKRQIMKEISESYDPSGKALDPVGTDAKKIIATKLKDFINDKSVQFLGDEVGGKVSRLNNIMHSAYTVKPDLVSEIAADMKGTTSKTIPPYGALLYKLSKGADIVTGGQTGQLARASFGQTVGEIADKIGLTNQIPRTVNNWLDYKNVIYSRLAVSNPFLADLFKRNTDNPVTAKAFLQQNSRMIAGILDQQGILEPSPYGEIDGVPSQEGAIKYRRDVFMDKNKNTFQKAQEIDRFNREGTLYTIKEKNQGNSVLDDLIRGEK